ncbi:extracellular solute-binding protein [Pseudalkalibacillus salsuginis]|uniref:extracellular solute-binding protein n=1 Tax=Pseudalkalibacillus salsuginis TaxID=2910972 RepID=UPI001F449CFD|nr:extracellular solute-binding protein [Pseudalkalibacillus salsuginis]MCF6409985.1 extracellular solute-binding protein [Pseudalkalibacillus salsuginis]
MLRKRLNLSVVILALLLMLAACSFMGETDDSDKATDNKLKITAMDYRYGDPPPKDGPGLKMINKKFNVDYQPQFVPQGDYDEKLTAVVASGDLPDLIGFKGDDMKYYKWAGQGAFLPLNDYIDKYPTLKDVPDYVWDAMKVDGEIYGIPTYYPIYDLTPVIRKDWLDKLGLKVPTDYEELKEVALAFTKEDPDGNGKNDTYGIAIGEMINPDYDMGAYWNADTWIHKNEDGEYIPGYISDARKDLIELFADLYDEKAITPDFSVINWADTNKEFYSGKAGIFIGAPRGMSEAYMQSLLEINPDAEFAPIYPFKDPEGNTGYTAHPGYGGIIALSAEMAKDPDKIKKVLEVLDFGRTFYPRDQRNSNNDDFDWWWGHEGTGYTMQDDKAVLVENFASDGLAPSTYLVDNSMWAPSDEMNEYSKDYNVDKLSSLVADLEKMHSDTKHYVNPINGIVSETAQQKGGELNQLLINEQTKMIVGQRPISDWDKMVEEYMQKGGAKIIEEYNKQINDKNYWK